MGGVKLQVLTPSDLASKFNYASKEGAIEAHLANFGRFQFGTSFTNSVYYPLINTNACESMQAEADLALDSRLGVSGFVIVDAGGCSYEMKARNIEQMGAQAVIIIEDEPMEELEGTTEELMEQEIYDGTGQSVYIPTILISKEDGQKIKDLFNEQPDATLQFKVDLEASMPLQSAVTYELFYGSLLDLPSSLILDLYEYQHALKENAIFIPRVQTFDCTLCPEDIRVQHCIEDGLYCLTPPSDEIRELYPRVNEQQILWENIRAKCIYTIVEEYNSEDEHVFFNYLYNVRFSCLEAEGAITQNCANRVIAQLGISYWAVDRCSRQTALMKASDQKAQIVDLLEEDRYQATQLGNSLTPALYINGQQYNGELKGEPIFRQICQSFNMYQLPEVCDPTHDIQEDLGHQSDFIMPETWTHQHLVPILLGIFLLNICIIFCFIRGRKKRQEKEMQDQVQMHVQNYFRLQQDEQNRIQF